MAKNILPEEKPAMEAQSCTSVSDNDTNYKPELDVQVYLDALDKYERETLESNDADDCSTEAFKEASAFVAKLISQKMRSN